MSKNIAAIWQSPVPKHVITACSDILSTTDQGTIFFRADDIAVLDTQLSTLLHLFQGHRVPLCLAVVPTWMDQGKWEALQPFSPEDPLWCWHQHGYSHTNHQAEGKKCEFGSSRTETAIFTDVANGRQQLQQLLGNTFFPVFTPPWNRCSQDTLRILKETGFRGISRFKNASPKTPAELPDLAANVDLHTRKETSADQGWDNLLSELKQAAATGTIGMMIHHEQMNPASFTFLEGFLGLLTDSRLRTVTFRELLDPFPHCKQRC